LHAYLVYLNAHKPSLSSTAATDPDAAAGESYSHGLRRKVGRAAGDG